MSTGTLGQRFLRSVQIERDWQSCDAIAQYVPTAQVRQVLRRLGDVLANGATDRAWTLTGPYGTGKSLFAAFTLQLLSAVDTAQSEAWRILRLHDSELASFLYERLDGRRLFPIPVVGRRSSLARCLIKSVAGQLAILPATAERERLQASVAELLDLETRCPLDPADILNLLDEVKTVVKHAGYHGIVIVIDELGRILEHAASDPVRGDISLLQELAELASRSGQDPVLVLGILHQAFDQYARYLDTATRREWAKVQGRFVDIAFIEPPEQLMQLAAEALAEHQAVPRPDAEVVTAVAEIAAGEVLGLRPRLLEASLFRNLVERAAPLHPVVLVVLPYLFRRLAQNERSLFTYLLAREPFGFQAKARQHPGAWVRLPDLFDYVAVNLGNSLSRHPLFQRWLEVVQKIDEHPELSSVEVAILKTIGVLDVLAEGSHLRPTPELISFALADTPGDADIRTGLEGLQKRSLIIFRRFNRSYRVWEGSDVDIPARLEEARRRTAGQHRLGAILGRYLRARPQVARRHSFETGTLRFFEVRYLDEPLSAEQLRPHSGDGVIACCLPRNEVEAEAFREWACGEEIAKRSNLIVALPEQIGSLREATAELVALHWVRENTPSLRDDRVARRELDTRTAEVEQEIRRLLDRLLDPRPAPFGSRCSWYWLGKRQPIDHPREVAALLSRAMDQHYSLSPRIWNELINRRVLSTAAAAARRNLIERMLTASNRPRLGLTGFPPERAIYESVLFATGLHRPNEHGEWGFRSPRPDTDPARLSPLWEMMEKRVLGATERPIGLEELFRELGKPPFGVTEGLLPILFCAFFFEYRNEVSLYRNGVFLPEPSVADFEILLRRPDRFEVGGARVVGGRKLVLERLADRLGTEPAILPVVRTLLAAMRALPEHAWRTQRLPRAVIELRETCARASSPERLLFFDLPTALGEMPFGTEEVDPARIDRFLERLSEALTALGQATPRVIEEARDRLLEACGLPHGMEGWKALRALAQRLERAAFPPDLAGLLVRLRQEQDDEASVESVLAYLATRPPRLWTDDDVERACTQARIIGKRLRTVAATWDCLTPQDEALSEEIARRVREILPVNVPRHVLRAALLRLLQETD
ncbi:MAG: hypothetical protein J7453_11620 [Thermomicrobium sp.]|nr:hypothetical protein [Thermomicrobium sp.]